MEHGLIHLYYGFGKGKTSSAIGLAVRASGHNKKVLMTSFLKDFTSGEFKAIEESHLLIDVLRHSCVTKFFNQMSTEEKQITKCEQADLFLKVTEKAISEEYDVIILDEIIDAIDLKCVNINQVINFLYNKPQGLEVVLTGHSYNKFLYEIADYVTEFISLKHPFLKGIPAREGIEK